MDKRKTFFNIALELAKLSTCKKRAVGCVITTNDYHNIVSIGYNGWPVGFNNNKCRAPTYDPCGCVHAEHNACLKIRTHRSDLICFVTELPCEKCAQSIIQTQQISKVVLKDRQYDTSFKGYDLLKAGGISVDFIQ